MVPSAFSLTPSLNASTIAFGKIASGLANSRGSSYVRRDPRTLKAPELPVFTATDSLDPRNAGDVARSRSKAHNTAGRSLTWQDYRSEMSLFKLRSLSIADAGVEYVKVMYAPSLVTV